MRIATWNVNSLKARLERVEEWLTYAKPDVLCMQETKLADNAFPSMAFAALGYETVAHGDGRWNGVAIASRVGLNNIVTGFTAAVEEEAVERRALWATCGGVRICTVYVPNGRSVDDPQYEYKLDWLARLSQAIENDYKSDEQLVICGDFNIAPTDIDVWNISKFKGETHVSPPERAALKKMIDWGLVDVFRAVYPTEQVFSWWDYRRGDFHEGRGMRIDLMLATAPIAEHVRYVLIDRQARKGKLPSDHAPMFVDVDI